MALARCVSVLMATKTQSSTSRDLHKAPIGSGSTASEELTLTAVTPSPPPLVPLPPLVSTRALRVQQHQIEEGLTVLAYPHQRVRRLRQRYRPLRPDHQRVAPAAHAAYAALIGAPTAATPVVATPALAKTIPVTTAATMQAQLVAEFRRQRSPSSSWEYMTTMLRLAIADVVGQTRGPAERHVVLLGLHRAFPAVVSLRHLWAWQSLVALLLVACNGGALYYIVSKAAVRGYGWQVSFLKIAAFEWCSEVVLLQSLEVWLFDYGLCWLVQDEVEAAVGTVVSAASAATVPSSANIAEEGRGAGAEASSSVNDGDDESRGGAPLSWAMARQWPSLPESRWLQSLWSSLPLVSTATGDTWLPRWMRQRRWMRLLSRGSQETWETVVASVATLLLAWVVFMYYRFVHRWLSGLSTAMRAVAIAWNRV
eukprot:gene10248-biopygen4581